MVDWSKVESPLDRQKRGFNEFVDGQREIIRDRARVHLKTLGITIGVEPFQNEDVDSGEADQK